VDSVLSAARHARDVAVRVASDSPPSEATDLVASLEPVQRPGLIGLADFLRSHDVTADDMICRTSIPGVDMIPSGSTGFPQEGLAASRLTDLLDECRRRYTMILLAGPPTLQPSDLQMLSARADAILFTLPRSGRSNTQGEEVVRELLELGAPVIGIVG
jgi:Mrp family chromosome partitioning ATPase